MNNDIIDFFLICVFSSISIFLICYWLIYGVEKSNEFDRRIINDSRIRNRYYEQL